MTMSETPSASSHPTLRPPEDDDPPLGRDADGTPAGSPSAHCNSGSGSAPRSATPRPASASSPFAAKESVLRFLLLPSHVGVILLLEFLDTFRSFGLRFVQYNYVTNEFGITDARAGALLGIKGFVDTFFGLAGSILVDRYGVRKVTIAALSVAIIGRTLLAFGRTNASLYLALFLFSPCGDALLGVGLYMVALKKLTTPSTRPLVFALSYATFTLAGALTDVLVDGMRGGLEDLTVGEHIPGLAGVYTPLRQFVVVTWVVVLLTFVVAYCFLEDWTVIDLDDPEDDNSIPQQNDGGTDGETSEGEFEEPNNGFTADPVDAIPAKPMVKPRLLRRWFRNNYESIHREDDGVQNRNENDEGSRARRLPNYKMYRTQYSRSSEGNACLCGGMLQILKQAVALLRIRSTWRVIIFGFASFTIAMNWTATDMIMPPFLERRFGEDVPIYTVQSINLFGCLILSPIVGAYSSGREDFSIIMPGLWIMATSSIFVAIFPNVAGACAWQVFMTLGEVLWSPRQISWTASLAPTGSEGLFFAISHARSVVGPLTDFWMGAINERYNPNCPDCRDQYGHFCGTLSPEIDENNAFQCASVQESCDLFLDSIQQSCPRTCIECPSWEPADPSTCWYLILLVSMATPISVWFFLPFFRGNHKREESFYGLFSLTKNRFYGVCGAVDDQYNHHRVDGHQIYGQVESESLEGGEEREEEIETYNGDMELT